MALGTYNTDQAAIQVAPTPSTLLAFSKSGGKTRVFTPSYTLATTESAAETLTLIQLYKGDVVHTNLCSVYCPNPGTALVLDIGDDDSDGVDPDRYVDNLVASAGGTFVFSAGGTASVTQATPYTVVEDCLMQATFVTATSLNAVKLSFTIVISRNN